MATVQLKMTINRSALAAVGKKAAKKATVQAGYFVRDQARQNIISAGRVNTGRMLDGVVVRETSDGVRVVSTAPYSSFNEDGTRPFSMPRGRVMRFKPKGSAVFIFRRSRRGMAGIHFMKRAYEALRRRGHV